MSALAPVPMPRTLARVLLDITSATNRRNSADYRLSVIPDDEEAERSWGIADDELWDLRDEAKALILAVTGVTYDQIQGANL